jgi:TolB-like protein
MGSGANSEFRQSPLPERLCRLHLQQVASSATFARAEQLRRLLEWLAQRSLASNPAPPTEKEIAETVLGRRDFNPQIDSLVRKEMSRLREKLMLYYTKEGARDRVRIRHVSGYLLAFAWSESFAGESAGDSESPCLLILPLRSGPDLNQHGIELAEELLVRLGEMGGTKLVSPTTARSYLGRVGDIRGFAAECGSDFVVEGSLGLYDTQFRATLWFVDGRNGRTAAAGRFASTDLDEVARLAASWIQERIMSETPRH